jgi:hypothetical protein
MFKLIDPEVWHVVFAVGGAVVGWWLRHRQGDQALPAEVVDVAKAILDRRNKQQTQSQIDDLLASLKQQKGQDKP